MMFQYASMVRDYDRHIDTYAIDIVTFILRVLVFAALSAATLIIKWIILRCKSFLDNCRLYGENLKEMRSYIWNWQT